MNSFAKVRSSEVIPIRLQNLAALSLMVTAVVRVTVAFVCGTWISAKDHTPRHPERKRQQPLELRDLEYGEVWCW